MSTTGIGYVRVSTSPQLKNYSPDQQAQMIAQYAETNGIQLIGEPIVDAKSGRTLDRQGLTRVRELARSQQVQAVIVAFVDRLARNVEYINTLRRQFGEAGVDLHVVTIGRVTDSPEAGLMMNMAGSVAQFEVEHFARRSKLGKIGKARAGKWVGSGHAPYGYRKEGLKGEAQLVKVPAQVRVVKRIFDDYTQERLGIRAIAEALNREKIPAPDGGLWWWSTIKRLLSTRAYVGEIDYAGILIPLPDLACLDRAQFDRAQRLKAHNKEFSKRNCKHEYDLSNRLLCACGRKMFGESGVLYRCNSLNRPTDEHSCTYGKVYRSSIEPIVWEHVRGLLTPDRLEEGAQQADRITQARRPLSPGQQTIQEIERLKRRIAVILDNFGDDETLQAIAEEKARALSKEIKTLEAERVGEQARKRAAVVDETARKSVRENAAALREMIDDPDEVVRSRVLEALDVQVRLKTRRSGGRGIVIETIFGRSKMIAIRHNPGK